MTVFLLVGRDPGRARPGSTSMLSHRPRFPDDQLEEWDTGLFKPERGKNDTDGRSDLDRVQVVYQCT